MTPRDRDEEPSRVRESLDCNLNIPDVKNVLSVVENIYSPEQGKLVMLVEREEALFELYIVNLNGTFTYKQLTFEEYSERLRDLLELNYRKNKDGRNAQGMILVNAKKKIKEGER